MAVETTDNNNAIQLAKAGKFKELRKLLLSGEDVNYMNRQKETILSITIKQLHLFFKHKNDFLISCKYYLNVLMVLTEFDCDFDVPVDEDENTAFMAIMLLPLTEPVVRVIIDRVDLSKKNK